MRRLIITTMLALAPTALRAQQPDPAALRAAVRDWRTRNDHLLLRELADLLALPNLASDSAGIRANARLLVAMLERRGVEARLLEAPGSPPAVYGELRAAGRSRAAPTLMLYAHYDGQPVRAAEWVTPPWTPTLRDRPLEAGGQVIPLPDAPGRGDGEWRLYARSAGDDKAPVVAMLGALDALRAAGGAPSVNVKFFFEGEEEAGSPHVRDMLTRHADLLRADLWVFADGPVHQSRRPQVVLGVRGVTGVELTVYGPARALHSGHYGNWAPNPAARLAHLLASMRDERGRITIAGFYDDVKPITAAERRALRTVPRVDEALARDLRLGATEGGRTALAERIMLPALNVRGLQSGAVGSAAANAIPTEARASIDFRLVPAQTPARIRMLLARHLARQGYTVVAGREPTAEERMRHAKLVRVEWESGYPAVRTDVARPEVQALLRAVDEAVGAPVIRVPTLGGSLPMHDFADVLKVPLVVLPTVNHDNNQHAANENLRLQNLWDGVELFAGVLARLGALWPATPVP